MRSPGRGQKRLTVMLARAGTALSASPLGRILATGVRLRRIAPCAFCLGRTRAKNPRHFASGPAQRWQPAMKAAHPGEGGQIAHRTVSRAGTTRKPFQAPCPVSKHLGTRGNARATAHTARRFLPTGREELGHPVPSLPGDGGSAGRAECEQAGQELKRPLVGRPPKSPQLNGVVARAHLRSRTEVWSAYQGAPVGTPANP